MVLVPSVVHVWFACDAHFATQLQDQQWQRNSLRFGSVAANMITPFVFFSGPLLDTVLHYKGFRSHYTISPFDFWPMWHRRDMQDD